MKIIDLLNKIANGEEVPKKIKIKNNVYEWYRRCENTFNYRLSYDGKLVDSYLSDDWFIDSKDMLNDEVEILEEEKKIPEKLNVIAYEKCIHEVTHKEKQLALEIRETQIAFNEIIDYLKSKGE